MPKFELFKGSDDKYYFRLKAANGEIVAHTQGYATKQGAQDGIVSVKKNAPIATTVDLTKPVTTSVHKTLYTITNIKLSYARMVSIPVFAYAILYFYYDVKHAA